MLVVDAIGKTFSGTGMDTNVIGYRGVRDGEDLTSPRIHVIAALSLAEASHGNAIGVGLADFITRDLRDAIDEQKTFLNAFTTGHMERAKIPATFANDEELIDHDRPPLRRRSAGSSSPTRSTSTRSMRARTWRKSWRRIRCARSNLRPVALEFDAGRHCLAF